MIFNVKQRAQANLQQLETFFTKVNRAGKITDGGVAGTKVSRAHPTAAEVAAAWSVWLTAGACPASQAGGAVVSLLR